MDAFHDVRLPDDVERGASGGPGFLTTIVALSSGFEQRNARWALERGRWNVGYGVGRKDLYSRILEFYRARRGRLFGFRFKDFADFELTNGVIGQGNGSDTQFQLVRIYADIGGSYTRPLNKPVENTTRIFLDGVETMDFTVDTSTGVVTLATAPANGVEVTATCEFDVPVRFADDNLELNLIYIDGGSYNSIPLVELRQEEVELNVA